MYFGSLPLAAATATLAIAAPVEKRAKKFKSNDFLVFGVNESGPEFDYVWPTISTIDTFINAGFNTFRINIMIERVVPNKLTNSLDSAYFKDLDDRTLATPYKDNQHVIFDTNNEFHDMDQTLVVNLNQAAINGIRAAGAMKQYIHVEGNDWNGAWTWTTGKNGATMGALTDPSNLIVYQMHQYLDADGSGTHAECVSSTIGQERIKAATDWLRSNMKCQTAIKGMLDYMSKNTEVWQGALWWAARPWWADYMYSIKPSSSTAYKYYMSTLQTAA
ncbi:glycoside hydrolase [Byssothecium circinans]|uniref:cellulase n=1 Tax=Byssothecium circinans TaxID=147558 RepID=A0A6A5UEK2_9PLEO|nr:glycoside hydrolase [Byssothecium circinans]